MYYQQAQYMYMQQPYMYPGGMPGVPPVAGAQQQYPYGAQEGYPQNAAGQEMQPQNSNRVSVCGCAVMVYCSSFFVCARN